MSGLKSTHNPIGSREIFLILLLITTLTVDIEDMTHKGGTSGACAACKYQRRRCAADCPLAPYFPAEQPKLFQNVHRLFGVRSIVKILENLDEAQKPEAMKSIIFQSYIRDRNPIHGCLGVVQQLQYMIWLAEEELKAVNAQLQFYRSQENNNGQNQMINEIGEKQQLEDVTSQLDLGMGLNVNNSNAESNIPLFFNPLPVSETHQPQMSYAYSCGEVNNNNSNYIPSSAAWDHNRFPYHQNIQNDSCNEMVQSNNGVMALQSQLLNLQMVSNKQHNEEDDDDSHEYDEEIHQFLELIEERQTSFADSKEAYASSSGESLKEATDKIGDHHELRSAATCFSLTNAN